MTHRVFAGLAVRSREGLRRRSLTTLVLMLTTCTLVGGGPVGGPVRADAAVTHVVRSSRLVFFHAALGHGRRADCVKNGTGTYPQLRCDRFRFRPPPAAQGVSVQIFRGKAGRYVPSDAVPDPSGSRLRAGHVLQLGRFSCRALVARLRCRDIRTGHGFVMRARSVRFF
jgi:hypothetical protein